MDSMNSMAAMGPAVTIIYLIFVVFYLIVSWIIFRKAGKPGWAILIPIYNIIVFCQVAGKPWWWLFLLCIPIVNVVILILLLIGLAKSFGKGGGFAAGLIFLGFIFMPILAFGKAQYVGAKKA